MIWADRQGNIGWQRLVSHQYAGILACFVTVPGDGRYEWDGYLPIKAKPNEFNPDRGYRNF